MFSSVSSASSAVILAVLVGLAVLLWRKTMRALDRAHVADWGGRWLNRLDGLNRLFCRRYHRLSAECLPLPASGPVLLASNHISGLDPLLLIAASPRPLRFLIAKEQYERFGMRWLFRAVGCIPVDRTSRPERAFREALKALQAGDVVALFPHGAIHLDTDPPRPLKPGVARLAHLAGVPVVVARIDGVRGQGRVVASVFLRSRARIVTHPAVFCHELETQDCLRRLAALMGHTHD